MPSLLKKNYGENEFSIISDGIVYKDCWESIDIKLSMNNICNEIRIGTLNFFESPLLKFIDEWTLKKGSKYRAVINFETVSVGYIDDITINYDGNSSSIEFYLRDVTSDLVDCCWYSETINEFKESTLENIVRTLCLPFGIPVIIDPLVQSQMVTIIKNYTIDQGRSVAELIVEECIKLGVLVTTDGLGNLYLTQPTMFDTSLDILSDTNILSCSMQSSLKDRFSNYITKAEMSLDKKYDTEQEYIVREKDGAYSNKKKIEDAELKTRFRPLILLSDTAQSVEDCTKRSLYEANIRRAKSLAINYTVQGWTEVISNRVWKPNRLVSVYDTKLNINEMMLINSVNMSYNESGFETNLELVRKECYSTNEQAIQLIKKGF